MTETTIRATTPPRNRAAILAICIGILLTCTVAVLPTIGVGYDSVVAHLRSGYPAYSASDIGVAAGLWVAILASVGAAGFLAWLGMLWAVLARQGWARWLAAALLAVALLIAVVGLTEQDTSGDVGLAPLIGWLQLVPCLAGAAVVVALWRRSGVR